MASLAVWQLRRKLCRNSKCLAFLHERKQSVSVSRLQVFTSSTWQYFPVRAKSRDSQRGEGGLMLFTCKSRNRHGQRMILEFKLKYFCFRSLGIDLSCNNKWSVLCDIDCESAFKMCSDVRMMSAAAVSSLSSISCSMSSCGSICDLWGVTYPSDFIPGGGGHWIQHHHHRDQQDSNRLLVETRN